MRRYCNHPDLRDNLLPERLYDLTPEEENEFWEWAIDNIEKANAAGNYRIHLPHRYVYKHSSHWLNKFLEETRPVERKPITNADYYRSMAIEFDRICSFDVSDKEATKIIMQALEALRKRGLTYNDYLQWREANGFRQEGEIQPWDSRHPLFHLTGRKDSSTT